MLALFRKEINSFFSSLTGYLVMIVFLVANGLFMWVFPGELNLIDSGYASLDTLFMMAPWIFLFLVPAITMRQFAEERKTGTLELLLARPLTAMQLVWAKYLASLALVLLALLPTLVYFLSVFLLADPPGNMDLGATWGSYLGLFFLASLYASIGIFCSSITDNQIIAFVLAAVLSFFMYLGFESIGSLPFLQKVNDLVIRVGISEHYQSMSRGVIDSRDLVYFLCWNFAFLYLTKTVLEKRS